MKGNTVREIAGKGAAVLKQAGVDSYRLDAELLLAKALGKGRYFLHMNPDYRPEDRPVEEFLALVGRRAAREPLQYLTGVQEFMGLEFAVNPSVLIPRPDTETLVETVLDWLKRGGAFGVPGPGAGSDTFFALDLGTGSGAIAVSLAFYCPRLKVKAVDISPEALETAKGNAIKHGVADRVEFIMGDLFSPFEGTGDRFNLIVSNPPYISREEMHKVQREVGYEPQAALYGGVDGLDFYRRIAEKAYRFLKSNGLLAVEIGYDQAEAVQDILIKSGAYTGVQVVKDLAGRNRTVLALTKL